MANSFSAPYITYCRNSTVHCVNELCYILIILMFNFLQVTLKLSLTQKLKLIFKFSTIKGQINDHFGPTCGIKDKERMEKFL